MLRALDLFCKAGGATKGLQMAGFHVTGVDIEPQPRYCGDEFIQGDALEVDLSGYDLIWASPPCQAYTNQGKVSGKPHPKLIEPTRERLKGSATPFVIENVMGAPLLRPVKLCGSSFGLGVRRHRNFESSFFFSSISCMHFGQEVRAYYGAWGREAFRAKKPGNKDTLRGTVERAPQDMGINWMNWRELTQAIPPAYSHYIAQEFLKWRESVAAPKGKR